MHKSKKFLSLIILFIGVAVIARTIMVTGGLSLSAGLVAGTAFAVYGAARLYFLRGSS